MLHLQRFTVNFIEENCYLLSDDSGEAVIVDCGAYAPQEQDDIRQYIAAHGLTLRHQLYTHGHFDHIFGAAFITDTYHLSPTIGSDEVTTYHRAAEQMQQFLHRSLPLTVPPVGAVLHEGDTISFGHHTLSVIATPGHTPGGLCFYCAEEGLLLSGDSLFRYSIGRCDLPGGNEAALIDALRRKVLTLPPEVKVYPGHGPATTIGEEQQYNRYLQ